MLSCSGEKYSHIAASTVDKQARVDHVPFDCKL